MKGGFAVELRLIDKARSTKDIDILFLSSELDTLSALRNVGLLDLNDWFQFDVQLSKELNPENLGSLRYHIVPQFDGRAFEAFLMDIGVLVILS